MSLSTFSGLQRRPAFATLAACSFLSFSGGKGLDLHNPVLLWFPGYKAPWGWAAVGFLVASCSTSALGLECPGVTALAFIPLTEGIQRIPAPYRPRGKCWLRRGSVSSVSNGPTLTVLFQEHRERHEGAPGDFEDCGDQSNAKLQSGNVTIGWGWLTHRPIWVGDNTSPSKRPLT